MNHPHPHGTETSQSPLTSAVADGAIEWRDPATLRVHPVAKTLHDLADDDARFLTIVVSMERTGFAADKPVTIDEQCRILDGRHRWRAAKRLQLQRIPCVVRSETEAATIILDSIACRKHYTKSAVAFECYPLVKGAHEEARSRRLEMLRKGQQIPVVDGIGYGTTVNGLALQIGICRDLFMQASKVHALFAKDPDYAAQMLPRIFGEPVGGEHADARPVGLGAVLAGYKGKQVDKGGPPDDAKSQLELFTKTVEDGITRWDYWKGLSDHDKAQHWGKVRKAALALQHDRATAMADYYTKLATVFRDAAKTDPGHE